MSEITHIASDETLQGISSTLESMAGYATLEDRISSLNSTYLANESIVETVGSPVYVDDVTPYAAYGITDSGWYVFCRVMSPDGERVTSSTAITGAAGYIANLGDNHVDLAVRFGVTAQSQKVVIEWGNNTDCIVFKATDLAINNLDYRVTFYVYDIADFATWEYKVATGTYAELVGYYTLEGDEYTQIEVTTGDTVPNYYVQVVSYALTADETFQSGTTYYTYDGTAYTVAEVTTGEAVTANTYYVQSTTYELVEGGSTFEAGITYYTYNGTTYTAVETVTTGDTVPDNVYQHSKVTFEGMTRNITYRCNTTIDCPVVFVLPEVEDDGHGCWFEIRFRHAGSYSSTLQVPEGVKVATEHTQAETKGINMVDLHYSDVAGAKVWRFMNTHSSIPA